MENHDELIKVLNDLLRINMDRVAGYDKASAELQPTDIDLKTLFTNMKGHSEQFISELTATIQSLGGEPARDTTGSGKIYRIWMDVKATLTAHDRRSIVALCEFGEDAAVKTYREALALKGLPEEVCQLLQSQFDTVKSGHDVVKRYRDMQEAVAKG